MFHVRLVRGSGFNVRGSAFRVRRNLEHGTGNVELCGSVRIAIEQVAEAAEDRATLASGSTRRRRGLVDAIGHSAERQRLQPHATGAGQHCVEQTLSTEERGLDL